MKGIIFNLAEEVVTRAHGADAWDDLIDRTGLAGAYTSLGSYPDEELFLLVGAAAGVLGVSTKDVLRQIGEGAIPLLVDRFAALFADHTSAHSFVLTLNDIIHPEVRKLYPGAIVPEFTFESPDDTTLVIGYSSARRLCALAEGFILGAASYYHETVVIAQERCMLDGAPECRIVCRFAGG